MTLETSRDNNKPMSEPTVTEPSLPTLPIPQIVQQYLDGETITNLAGNARRSRQTIYNWMHSEVTDQQWPQLVRQAIVNRIADADQMLEESFTPVDIARAREIAKFARWDAERRLKMFQPKQEVSKDSKITVIIQRDRAATPQQVVVEAQSVRELTDNTVDSVNPQ